MRAYGEIVERLRRSTVQIFNSGAGSQGSGILWNSDGLVVTNAHVARSGRLEVLLWDGRRLTATVERRDARRDLAALRIEASGLPTAAPGDSRQVRAGQLVLAVGNPLGFAGAVSSGIVHSVGPVVGMGSQTWIRAGVRLAPGNSGGPLAAADGSIIGVNTAVMNGLGLAIPSHVVLEFLSRGAAPSLGITLQPVDLGIRIVELEPHGAGANAGLRAGDVLLIRHDALLSALDSGKPLLKLHFLRGERWKIREATIRLAAPVEAAA